MIHSDHNVNNVCLTLINEGSLYLRHCEMAGNDVPGPAGIAVWRAHIAHYGHRFTDVALTGAKLGIAAAIMRKYYVEHLLEG